MKSKYLYSLLFLIVLVLWIGRGLYLSKKSIQMEKQLSIQGCVTKMNRYEGHKTYDITLDNGNKINLASFEMNELIDVGDSIFKKSGSLKYHIYKLDKGKRVKDSIIYLASDKIQINPFRKAN